MREGGETFVNVEALYSLPLFVSKEFRLYHRFVNKTPGARGVFICSRLLTLVVEPSFSPEKAWLLITIAFKLSFEAVGFPAIHRIFFVKNKATPLNGQYVIAKALYPLLLHVSM